MTHGTSLIEIVGQVKGKINEDMSQKFLNFKSHIKDLENVIDRNSKLIRDLTESIQDKNIENQALINEDKIRQGKLE